MTDCESRDRKELTRIKTLYYELLYAVAQKYPDESRHETALRYIREREQASTTGDACAAQEAK